MCVWLVVYQLQQQQQHEEEGDCYGNSVNNQMQQHMFVMKLEFYFLKLI
jgi:hypothetical protein